MALTVKEVVLLTLKGAPEMPFGVESLLVSEDAKLLWSWLAMVEAAAAISDSDLSLDWKLIITGNIKLYNAEIVISFAGGCELIMFKQMFLIGWDCVSYLITYPYWGPRIWDVDICGTSSIFITTFIPC